MNSIGRCSRTKSSHIFVIFQKSTFCTVLILLVIFVKCNECRVMKRSASPDYNLENTESVADKISVNYDEYPMVVPKRAAMLLDRIMVALHHALEDGDTEGVQRISDLYKDSRHSSKNSRLGKEKLQHYKDNENDMNYYEIPNDVNSENHLNRIEGRHSTDDSMGLQRRGHGEGLGSNKGRVYWRCYFNAVTCF